MDEDSEPDDRDWRRAIVTAAVLLGCWAGGVALFEPPGYILPGPWRVAETLVARAGYLAHHGLITLAEIVLGLVVATIVGGFVAILMTALAPARRYILPLVVMSQALPVFAIAPLLVVWFGYGIASKVVMATLIIFFPVVSAFFDGLNRTPSGLLDIARLYRAPRLATLRFVRLPAALPHLATGLRVAAGIAPIGAVVGEWVGASAGLGFVMLQANARTQTDVVFAALVVLALVAVGLRTLVDRLTRRLVFWPAEAV